MYVCVFVCVCGCVCVCDSMNKITKLWKTGEGTKNICFGYLYPDPRGKENILKNRTQEDMHPVKSSKPPHHP